ncbi:MAG TPA: polysaccharide deacetylase family protein [Polyangiaceae bacterium]|nr:polysaccharide deacetylase family protein [Polyangiaceae bacterium]
MSALSRALLPVVALGVGTWLGMGRPPANVAFAAGARALASAAHAAREATEPGRTSMQPDVPGPPLDRPPPQVAPSALPDPALPWPQLNPEETSSRAWIVANGPAHAPDDGHRYVTFTFDDGPFPETAPTMLRILSDHHIRATFFLIGKYLEGDDTRAEETRGWAKRIADAGHFVGNHTRDHRLLTGLSHAQALEQIDDAAADIERATGHRPVLFRPPYGEMDAFLEGAARDRHLELVLWNVDVEDMKKQDPDEIVTDLQQQLEYQQGGIVLLHDMHWPTVKAFNRLVRWLESNRWDPSHPDHLGWDIVDLPTYLKATAAAPQPYATREDLEAARKAFAARHGH